MRFVLALLLLIATSGCSITPALAQPPTPHPHCGPAERMLGMINQITPIKHVVRLSTAVQTQAVLEWSTKMGLSDGTEGYTLALVLVHMNGQMGLALGVASASPDAVEDDELPGAKLCTGGTLSPEATQSLMRAIQGDNA